VSVVPHPEPPSNPSSPSLPVLIRANPSFPFRATRPRASEKPSTSQNSYTRKDFKSFRFSTYKHFLMMLKTNDFKPFRISRSTIFARNPFGFCTYIKTPGGGGIRSMSHKSCLSPRASASSAPPCVSASLPRSYARHSPLITRHWRLASACTPVLRTGYAHLIGDRIGRLCRR
jgi:hypothetical protein